MAVNEEFILDLEALDGEDSSKQAAQILLETIAYEKAFPQSLVKDFLNKCLKNLENPSISIKTKLYTLMIFRFFRGKDNPNNAKILSSLSTHQLFNFMIQTAMKVDPKKPISEKGKQLSSDRDSGNKYIRLLLESIMYWSNAYPTNRQKQPSKFKKACQQLIDDNVTMPKEFTYYEKLQKKESGDPRNSKMETPVQPSKIQEKKESELKPKIEPEKNSKKESTKNYGNEIRFLANKIEDLIGIIEDEKSVEKIERDINNYHAIFQADMAKFEAADQQILETQSKEIVELYFKVIEFLTFEQKLYKRTIQKADDYSSYATEYVGTFDKMFDEKNQPPPVSKKAGVSKKPSGKEEREPKPVKSSVVKISKEEPSINMTHSEYNSNPGRPNKMKNNEASYFGSFIQNLETRSKSPVAGFSNVKKSIQKEKKTVTLQIPRSKSRKNSQNKHGSGMAMSSLVKSNIKMSGIFMNPPNTVLAPKNYEGELVIESSELQKILYDIKKGQGHRKFKIASFRDKYLLFENDNLQVGFKSEQIYEKVGKYDAIIGIEVYVGNKSENKLEGLEVSFHGDRNCLLYTNPQKINEDIYPGTQAKQELMIIPKNIPFGFLNMRISYLFRGALVHTSVALPNSILKIARYFPLEKDEFSTYWKHDCKSFMKTEAFRLSRFFEPTKLSHNIAELTQLSSYSDFVEEGSTTDYQLGCRVVVQERHEGILKIVVRPDLSCVLQMGVMGSDTGNVDLKFYLQTLQLLLRETES